MSNILDLKVLLLSYISRLRLNILVHWKPLPLYKGHLTLRWNTSFGHRNSLWICRHCDEDSSLRRNVVKYWAFFLQLCWSIHMTIDQGKKKREKKRKRKRERQRETDRQMDGWRDPTWPNLTACGVIDERALSGSLFHLTIRRKDTQSYIYGVTLIWLLKLTDVSIKKYFC